MLIYQLIVNMNERFTDICKRYDGALSFYEDRLKVLEKTVAEIQKDYRQSITDEFNKVLGETCFFKTLDGYISVSKIKDVHVSGLSKYQPRIVVEGFYVRGIDCDKPARYLYGYYDNCAGFLLSELSPITSDLFCEKVKTVCSDIIKNLTYKPTYLYREDGDKFDNFIKDARKCGIDIEYYPELHVSVK